MDTVRLCICLLFLVRESNCDIQLTTSIERPTAGFSFSFICRFNQNSVTFNKNNSPYCTISLNKEGECVVDSNCPKQDTPSCNFPTFTMSLPGQLVTDSLHESKWHCVSIFGSEISNEVQLYVIIPIKYVNIQATPVDNNPVKIVTGLTQQFECETDAGRPSSRIEWYLSGTNITSSATSQVDDCTPACNGKVVSSSVLLYVGNRGDESKNISCIAMNIENQSVESQNRTVFILYGPSEVNISPVYRNYTVKETDGSIGPITCSTDKCKPNCTIKWSGPTSLAANTSVLQLQNITRNQAGSYKCTVSNIAWSNTSFTINVVVEYGPNKVNISSSNRTYTVTEKKGSVGPITCSADCEPDCTMTWRRNNVSVGTTSLLHLTNIEKSQAGNYQCTATNSVGSISSVTIIIIVHYGPQQVSIFPSTKTYNVTESSGKVGPINCTSDCKPICIMKWNGPNLPDRNTSVLNLLAIDRNQTGNYTCTASNIVSFQHSDRVIVNVNYGPRRVNIFPLTERYTVIENTESVNPFNCTADCKPDCNMTWTGPYLPKGTSSILIIQQIQKNQAGNYTCVASNEVGNLESSSVRIVVLYGPDQVILYPDEKHYTVNETNSVIPITCSSDCKPECTMTWNGSNIEGDTKSVLNLTNIDRTQAGNYMCIASNHVSTKTSLSINITVNFKPAIYDLLGNLTYNENDTVTFFCNVESVPDASTIWTFEDSVLNSAEIVSVDMSSKDSSTLNIHAVGCLSMGTYKCRAMNIIGEDSKAIDIDITCSPRINALEYNVSTLIAVKDQEPLNITAPIIAFPEPFIYWTFVNNNTLLNVTHKTSNSVIKNRVFSHLYIANVTEDDFGFYLVYAYNKIGKTTNAIHSFEVIPERKPNPPKNVTCYGRPDSVLVHWKSNFNGGDTQIFHIHIKKNGELSFHDAGLAYSDPGQNRYSEATISKLTPSTTYHFKVRASNKHNYSMSETASCNTTSAVRDNLRSTSTTAVGVGTGIGAATITLIVVAVVFIIRRRRNEGKLGHDKEPIHSSVAKDEESDEDGLKENPLYVSSAQEDIGAVYSTVDKSKQNVKHKDKLRDESTVHTQVVKKKPKSTGKAPACKGKKTSNKDVAKKEIEMGYVYANSGDITHGHADDVYANSEVKHKIEDKDVYVPKKNKDGLIYADLDLAPAMSGKRFVIRGLENRNNYAVLDLTKRAEPLSSESDSDDNQTEKNIEEE